MSKLAKIMGLTKEDEVAVRFVAKAGSLRGEMLLRLDARGRLVVHGFKIEDPTPPVDGDERTGGAACADYRRGAAAGWDAHVSEVKRKAEEGSR